MTHVDPGARGEQEKPGNVSALSSEVERMIEEATRRCEDVAERVLPTPMHKFLPADYSPILRELVRKALGTVEAERDALKDVMADEVGENLRLAQRLGFWHLVEAGESWSGAAEETFDGLREQARALAEALRVAKQSLEDAVAQAGLAAHHLAAPHRADWLRGEVAAEAKAGIVAASEALASWDTSQKESR